MTEYDRQKDTGAHMAQPLSPEAADTIAGDYVLGTLPAESRREVQARLPHEPLLQAALAQWEQRLLPLTALVESVAPEPALWERIDRSTRAATVTAAPSPIAQKPPAPRDAPATQPRPSFWHSLPVWRGLSGAGFAAAAVFASLLVTQHLQNLPAGPQYLVVLSVPQTQAAGWVVQTASAGALSLVPVGASAALPEQKALQFWTKADGWAAPVSLGLVVPGQAIRVPLDKLPPLQANQLFELTLEPATGSLTGRPTGPIQFIGRAVQVHT